MTKSASSSLIELNEKSYEIIEKVWRKNIDTTKNELIIDYFTNLITEGKSSSARRQLTIETINRYVFCLNQIVSS